MIRLLFSLSLLFFMAEYSNGTEDESNPQRSLSGSQSISKPIQNRYLANAYQLHEKVISGGQPEMEAGFQALQSLGVRTVVSVDGAKPNVALAKKYGMRYVHLPHGYDGIPEQRAKELAKAVSELPGVVYIHCHHGKHRSPAAAAVACIGNGIMTAKAGKAVLKSVGTSPNYRGLFKSVEEAHTFEGQLLKELDVEFRETVELPPVAEAMVELEFTFHQLQSIATSGWVAPPDHPDLEPTHEALLLKEHFVELMRTEHVQQKPRRFRQMVQESQRAAEQLEEQLKELGVNSNSKVAEERLNSIFLIVTKNCKSCHREYRDIPLDEKGR